MWVKVQVFRPGQFFIDRFDEKVENSSVQIESQDDIVNVDLGNGIVAKMKVSDLEKVAPA